VAIKRRIFISGPRDKHLDDRRNEIKWAIIEEIEKLGYDPQVFGSREGGRGLAAGKTWSPDEADKVMQRCVGAAILGFPIWNFPSGNQSVSLVTEYCHYEGAIARTYKLPILAVLEEGVEERVLFMPYAGDPVIQAPLGAERVWVNTPDFRGFFNSWVKRLKTRRDIFLGYCSSSEHIAEKVKRYLVNSLKVTALDWRTDFAPAGSILEAIQEAESRCSAGIFLFTKDDTLQLEGEAERAVPRDNVVFEAGYFARAKGKDRVLIILEKGSKIPADLGGDIYAPLTNRGDISDLEPYLKRFIQQRL
jgi:hypothetical protein